MLDLPPRSNSCGLIRLTRMGLMKMRRGLCARAARHRLIVVQFGGNEPPIEVPARLFFAYPNIDLGAEASLFSFLSL